MKKSNWIILAAFVIASAFLLWLWYFLAYNKVDNPLDLVLSVIWWAVIAIVVFAIWKVEQARRRRVRTVYVGRKAIFNSEAGMVPYADRAGLIGEAERVLDGLKYGFEREDMPQRERFAIDFIIRTDEYKPQDAGVADAAAASQDQSAPGTWKGEVVLAQTKEERPFEDKAQLVRILNSI